MLIKTHHKQIMGLILFLCFITTRIALYASGGKLLFLVCLSYLLIAFLVYWFGAINGVLIAALIGFTDIYLIYPFLQKIYGNPGIIVYYAVFLMASYLTLAIMGGLWVERNWIQIAKLKRAKRELEVAQEINKSIPMTLERDKLLDKVLELAVQIIKTAEIGAILLVDPADGELVIQGTYEYPNNIRGTRIGRNEGYTGWVAENKKPLLVEDVQYDFSQGRYLSKLSKIKEDLGIKSSLATPILVSDELIGVIILHNTTRTHAFTIEDLKTLSSIASQAAVAIQNTEFYERARRSAAETLVVFKVGQAITSKLQMDELLNFIMDSVIQMFGANEGSIMLFDKDNLLHIKASHGLNEETVKKTKVKPGEGIAGWVALNKKPVLVTDITRDPRFQRLKPRAELCAALSVPLIVKERVVGVLNLSSICPAKFDHSDLRLLTTLASQIGVSIENAKLFKEMEEIYLDTVKAFIAAIEAKDPYTRGHSEQVAKYAVAIAKVMNLSEQEVEIIKSAALLHDIGKIGIHEDILNKPGSLTDEEYEMVKAHPFIAVQIISHVPRMKEVVPIIYHHHEHYNGNGYCCGLKGKGIPLGARILAVADAFDAMTSARPYRNAMGLSDVINELKRNANLQFDPQVVKVFCKAIEKHPELTQDILDLEELEVESSESQERTH